MKEILCQLGKHTDHLVTSTIGLSLLSPSLLKAKRKIFLLSLLMMVGCRIEHSWLLLHTRLVRSTTYSSINRLV